MTQKPIVPIFSAIAAREELDLPGLLGEVITSQRYVLGPRVDAFEQAFAAYIGAAHAIGVANGTDALEIALRGLGVGHGHSVVTVANAGFYGSTAIRALGAQPLYVDVDPVTLTLCPASLERALATKQVQAVIVTHLYGQLADMAAIMPLCRAAGVPLIEDCAQAHGARRENRLAGSFGDVACFSFYPTKNLGALGDGGALVTSDDAMAARIRSLRQYGWESKYQVVHDGGRNSRLDELQAAVLIAKLPLLDASNARRRAIAARYSAAFARLPVQAPLALGDDHVAHLYVLRSGRRDALRAHLATHGVSSDVHYPIPDHRQPVLGKTFASVRLPVTEEACQHVFSLPCFPGMLPAQVDQVIEAMQAFFEDDE